VRTMGNPRGSWSRYAISAVGGLALLGAGLASSVASVGAATASGGAYTAVTPTRLLDTRTTTALGANSTLPLVVETSTDGVPSTATAVSLNVTVTPDPSNLSASNASYLSVFPTGGSQPFVSNLNWVAGETVANSVIVPIGTGGSVTFYNHTGTVEVIADLEGYFAPEAGGAGGGAYVPLAPTRIDAGTALTSTSAATETATVQVSGLAGVPAGASAAMLNVTVTNTNMSSWLGVYPGAVPATNPTSLENWTAGGIVSNRILAPLSSTGTITVFNNSGNATVIVDVSGFFTGSAVTPATEPVKASLYSPVTPDRLVDTRVSGGTLGAGVSYLAQIAGQGGISSAATAAVLNVTAADTTLSGFFTVYPAGGTLGTSDVNWVGAGQVVPNLTVATLSSAGAVDVFNHSGSADLIVDTFGFFTPFVAPVISVTNSASSVGEGATSNITATVTAPGFTYPDQVIFTTAGAGCGSISSAEFPIAASGGTTGAQVYTAGSAPGPCVITATEAEGGNVATTTVTTTAAVDTVTLTGSIVSNHFNADGITQDTLTASVAGAGSNYKSDKVTFSVAGTSCGSLSPATATTAASGASPLAVTSIYTASSTFGFCTVTAAEANTAQSTTLVLDQTTSSVTAAAVALSPATTPAGEPATTTLANGTNSYVVTVTTTNGGSPFSDQVSLTMVPGTVGPPSSCGTLSSAVVTTNAAGTATVTYTTPAETPGSILTFNTCTINGVEAANNTGTGTNNSEIWQNSPSASNTIALTPLGYTDLSSGGIQIYTVNVTNINGNPVAESVTLTATGTCPVLPATVTTAGSGTAVYAYTATASAGFCQMKATDASGGASAIAIVDQS